MEEFENCGEDFDYLNLESTGKSKKRILLKNRKSASGVIHKGIVVTTKARFYIVKDIEEQEEKFYKCVVSGSLEVGHPHNTLVTVGDRCEFSISIQKADGLSLARIVKVEERKTFLMRKSISGNKEDILASNMDQVLILLSANNPPYNLRMLDRILVASEFGNLDAIICVNKMDIANYENIRKEFEVYEHIGYKVLYISAIKSYGIDKVYEIIKNKETLFIGVSGVGKSTLVNALFGKEIQKVGQLAKNLRGKHTTTSCNYLNLDAKTVIIDSPGFREFDLYGISREELPFYFREFETYFQRCKFQPCSHTHEPNCAVKTELMKGKISSQRYFSYIEIFESI
ncbi:MAG: ribosome small subunit-dependent GTPase A [Candidatus Kapaibacteriota bacterium]